MKAVLTDRCPVCGELTEKTYREETFGAPGSPVFGQRYHVRVGFVVDGFKCPKCGWSYPKHED